MKSDPLVSVIIPCFNVSAYVESAIKSILTQTYKELEIWIIDDASTDDTLQKVNAIKDHRIKIISFKENTQKIGAVNHVLKLVTGEYIAFQDADDWSEPSRISKEVGEFKNDAELGICFTGYKYAGGKNYSPGRISVTHAELIDEFHHFGQKQNTNLDATVCATMMISKKVLEETGGYHTYFKGRVGEDIYWVYKILKKFKGVGINEALYNYSLRTDSLTGLQFNGKNAKAGYAWQLLEKLIYKDINENIDLLEPEQVEKLKQIELEACEDALLKSIKNGIQIKAAYENSNSFKIGNKILSIFRILKK